MVKPISPNDIAVQKMKVIPEAVIKVVNELIAKNFTNGRAAILQKDIIAQLERYNITAREAYDKGYLNFEEIYREQGWKVTYDKPSYCETYEPRFIFGVK